MSKGQPLPRDLGRYIFDIGAHTGEDSDFYLRKGFKVVAVEALPSHVETLQRRFASFIEEGHYFIEPVAIGEEEGPGDFFVHHSKSDWHTAKPQAWRGEFEKTTVPFVRFKSLLEKYPVPYYLKIDIEGNDGLVIEALTPETRPRFLSFELGKGYEPWIEKLASIGFTLGQIVDQSRSALWKAPEPPREGRFVNAEFNGHMTGLFGRELRKKDWFPIEEMIKRVSVLPYNRGQWYDVHVFRPKHWGQS